MIRVSVSGSFQNSESFLKNLTKTDISRILRSYGETGVEALSAATPKKSGKTALSWDYEIVDLPNKKVIYWTNSNIQNGVPIAVIIQYGHGTRNGGYVTGTDYINPALRKIFDDIAEKVWKEVIK